MFLRRAWFWALAAAILTLGAASPPGIYRTAALGSGFMAQLLCSSTFLSHRDPETLVIEDMSGPGYELLWFFRWKVERDPKCVARSAAAAGRLGHLRPDANAGNTGRPIRRTCLAQDARFARARRAPMPEDAYYMLGHD
jgi:hypothetical protein